MTKENKYFRLCKGEYECGKRKCEGGLHLQVATEKGYEDYIRMMEEAMTLVNSWKK